MKDAYTFGIEEEYFLVDATTKLVTRDMPKTFLEIAKEATNGQVMGEFLQSQIEVATLPHHDIRTAHAELRHLRQTVAKIAADHGLAILAAGTHPTADWGRSQQSEGERYDAVMDDLQMIGQRNMLCGLHVHVELPDPDDRVDVMMRMLPYLPLFIALATSSPFWRSRPTGLKGYRLAAYDELPRTGVPELLRTKEEFDAYVDALVKAGVMQDASYVWWSMRPSLKHPTLELRAPDCPTLVDDSIAIAALWRSLARQARAQSRAQPRHQRGRAAPSWSRTNGGRSATACTARFVGDNGAITVADFVDQVVEETAADAEALGCLAEMQRCRTIVGSGTSADAQMAVYEKYRQDRRPRPRAQRRHRLARGDDAAVSRLAFVRQHGLHHEAAGAGIDHAEPAQREQRQRLHRFARTRAGSSMFSGASGPIRPSSNGAEQAERGEFARPAPADGRRRSRRGCAPRSRPPDRGDTAAAPHRCRYRPARRSPPRRACGCAAPGRRRSRCAAASADSGPGAASAARRTASISRSATLSTSAPTSSILPGK